MGTKSKKPRQAKTYRAARRNHVLKTPPRSTWRGVPTPWDTPRKGQFQQSEVGEK